jgi:hypothetical protein
MNYVAHYKVAVQHSDVSGFEMLDMLMVRDQLEARWNRLTLHEQNEVLAADRQLLSHADQFFAALSQVTRFDYERKQRQPGPERWWWYLDVLVQLPQSFRFESQPATA